MGVPRAPAEDRPTSVVVPMAGVEADPEGVAAVEMLPSGPQRDRAAWLVAERWARAEPGAALVWARGNLGGAAFRLLLARCETRVSPQVAMKLISEMRPPGRAVFFARSAFADEGHFLQRLARRDSRVAISWLAENEGLAAAARSAGRFGGIAATRDLGAAQVVVADLPPGAFRTGFVLEVASEFGRRNPVAAIVWADSLEESVAARLAVLRGWAATDPQSAAFYADKTGRVGELGAVVAQWSRDDAEAAYRWLVGAVGDEPEAVVLLLGETALLEKWGEQDPASAARGVLGFPEDLAALLLPGVIGGWAAVEPLRASAFVNDELGAGAVRDTAVAALVGEIGGDDPAAAVAWARTIEDEGVRISVLESLAVE